MNPCTIEVNDQIIFTDIEYIPKIKEDNTWECLVFHCPDINSFRMLRSSNPRHMKLLINLQPGIQIMNISNLFSMRSDPENLTVSMQFKQAIIAFE